MKKVDIAAEPREIGKHFSRSLRGQKKIPAIIYGALDKNANLYLNENDVLRFNTRAYENTLYNIKSSDKSVNGKVALMKAVDVHPLTRKPVHVDLLAIDLNKPVRIFVEIAFDGKPVGLAEGGMLNIVNRQIEIECKPTDIPESIKVDVSNLGVGDALHASEIQMPANIRLITLAETTLAVVNVIEEEATAAPAAAGTAATTAAPAAAAGKDAKAPATPAAAAGKDAKAPAAAKGEKKK